MSPLRLCAILLLSSSFWAPAARAQTVGDPLAVEVREGGDVEPESRVVIQNRKFRLGHEFTLQGGVFPLDPFYKGITASGRYTWHINDVHAWEVGAGTFAFNVQTPVTDQLINNFAIQRAQLPDLQFTVESNYVLKPFYGKFSLFNRTLVYNEIFFVAGALLSYWNDPLNAIRIGPNVGAGIRFFLAEWASVRLDMRQAVVFGQPPAEPFTIDAVLYLGAGLSLSFGG